MNRTVWNFAVVGCDGPDGSWPHYLAFFESREEALGKIKSFVAMGWRRVAVFDAYLKEVKVDQ